MRFWNYKLIQRLKIKLFCRALMKYGMGIKPAGDKKQFSDCFTTEGNKLILWFNDSCNSTHILMEEKR